MEIIHNTPWFASAPLGGTQDPDVAATVASADFVANERGLTDEGLTGGSGEFSLDAVFRWVDAVHALGAGVIYLSYGTTRSEAEYNVAGSLLTSDSRDGVSTAYRMLPRRWWPGYDTDLGAALGPRTRWEGLWRRDFARGMVLVNDPGAPAVTVALGAPMRSSEGRPVMSVDLEPARGVVLRR
jgi:hypothetical protein